MAGYETPQEIASAWIDDRRPTKRLDSMYAGSFRLDGQDCPALFSYGPHFPLAIKTAAGILVNADYYSRTTSRHQRATAFALGDAGYLLAGTTMVGPMPFSVFRNPWISYDADATERLNRQAGVVAA